MFNELKNNTYLFLLFSSLVLISISSCGGGGSEDKESPPNNSQQANGLIIDLDNYDLVLAYGYAVPESMLQIGQLVEKSLFEFRQQDNDIYISSCENGGQLEVNLEDADSNGILSAMDNLTLNFVDCYSPSVLQSIQGSIDLVVDSISDSESQYSIAADLDVYDAESSVSLAATSLNITFSKLIDSEVLQVSGTGDDTTLTIEGFAEQLGDFSVEKTVEKQTKEYRVDFNFSVDSSILDDDFSCSSTSPFHGYIYSLPLDYNFECEAENNIVVNNIAGDSPETFDTEVRINLINGVGETIFFNHDEYIEGTLQIPFAFDLIEYVTDAIEVQLDMGHVSSIQVDKQNNIAYLAAMVFHEESQGKIFKLNLSDMSVLEEIELPERVHRFKLSSDGSKLYLTQDTPNNWKVVEIYNTLDLSLETSVDIDTLGFNQFASDSIDITPLEGNSDRWVYYFYSFPNSYVLLFEGTSLLDSVTSENRDSIIYGSGFSSQSDRLFTMEITGNADRKATFTEFSIANNEIVLSQKSDFVHSSDIGGLSNSQYYQIRFEYEGQLYTDAGLVVSTSDLSLSLDANINKPALSEELGRVYDLNGVPEIKSFSLDQLNELSSLNSYEKPFSRHDYIVEDGNTGFIVLASGNMVYRVGKSLLP